MLHGEHAARRRALPEVGDGGEDERPAAPEPIPTPTQHKLGPLAAERDHGHDRQQRRDEDDVEQQHQAELVDEAETGADDRRQRREVGEGGRELGERDRRPERPGVAAAQLGPADADRG